MKRFLRAFAVVAVLASPLTLGACSLTGKDVASELNAERSTRQELLRTERVWQLTLGIIQVLKEKEVIIPNSDIARKMDAGIQIVEMAMDKWRKDPDSVTIKKFALEAIDAVKKIITEARS
jgi:uncharacterized protein with von Willebrand factor type A (vWA) domain